VSTNTQKIGFIGVGNLGGAIVTNMLRAGFTVTVFDTNKQVAQPLLDQGVQWADSVKAVAQVSDVVITCLPSPDIVDSVLTSDDGVLAGLARGKTWIDMSTSDSNEIKRLGAIANEHAVNVLESPVTGGVHKAASGALTILVGGNKDVFDANLNILQTVGNRVMHIGVLGQASKIKVVTNMLAFIHLVAVGEALMVSGKSGIDLKTAWEAIRWSSGDSFVHETEGQLILSGSYDINFTIDLALKDLGLVNDLAKSMGVPLELSSMVEQRYLAAKARYGGQAQSPRVVQILEDDMKFPLRAEGFPETLVGRDDI
jgi:3-hydroxyisobutyrate dehydrogenase